MIATTDGVRRSPSALGITIGSPPSMVAITEFVVPRSMPIIRAMCLFSYLAFVRNESVYAWKSGLSPTLTTAGRKRP